MKILSLFSRSFLTPAWTFTPEGTIWRLFPAESGELIGEARNQDSKKVTFFALDSETGTPLWQNLSFDEPWWIGIEDVTQNVLLLHKFGSPDMPQHRSIIAVDLRSGEYLWSNEELTFWFAWNGSVYAHKMMYEARVASELDARTGRILREISGASEASLVQIREQAVNSKRKDLQFPETIVTDDVALTLGAVIGKNVPAKETEGPLEFIHVDGFTVMSFHVRATASDESAHLLDNHLKIVDGESGRVVYSEIIVRGSPATAPDSFFVRNQTVYYIKEQKTLTAVSLPK